MRHFIGFIVPVVLGSALLLSCKAGTNPGFGGSGGTANTSGNGTSAANGQGSTSNGFGTGAQSTGAGTGCNTPDCIGMGQQGGCDSSLALDTSNPEDGAKAIGLCQKMSPGGWGLVSAEWVKSDLTTPLGSDPNLALGHGILSGFGTNVKPREGAKLLGLSSGTARNPGEPGYQSVSGFDKGASDNPPPGYPKESPSCPGVMTGQPHDSAGLKLVIHTPKDAKSISFDFDFYTYEFPNYICSQFNDFFVAFLTPKPANLMDPNISFDTMGNLISVNAGFLTACDPQTAGGKNFTCPLGYNQILGTGFDEQMGFGGPRGSAATGWLNTKAPVTPSTDITLAFAIWDSGDGILDSSVLIDNFKFQVDTTATGTT